MRIIAFSLSFIIFVMSGCSGQAKVETNKNRPIIAYVPEVMEYSVHIINEEYKLSLYEPKEGCYLGAYILTDKVINYDMHEFEAMTEKEHSMYIYNMRLGEAFPKNWILQCIGEMKTPYIIIYPPNDYMPFQEFLLEDAARQMGEFYVPMFVEFYPNPHQYQAESEDYVNFFQKASKAFRTYASNVSIVWSVDNKGVGDAMYFYPGDDFVDWVGVNIYAPVYYYGKMYERDIFNDIEYFYMLFQKRKPLMISQMGISHFSTVDHTYYNDRAAETIYNVYTKVKEEYPRIKAINYMNFNNIEESPKMSVRDNFLITNEDIIINQYAKAVASDYFLKEISIADSGSLDGETFKSPFKLYKIGNEFYISENMLRYDFGIDIGNEQNKIQIHNESCYPIRDFEIEIVTNDANRQAFLRTK